MTAGVVTARVRVEHAHYQAVDRLEFSLKWTLDSVFVIAVRVWTVSADTLIACFSVFVLFSY